MLFVRTRLHTLFYFVVPEEWEKRRLRASLPRPSIVKIFQMTLRPAVHVSRVFHLTKRMIPTSSNWMPPPTTPRTISTHSISRYGFLRHRENTNSSSSMRCICYPHLHSMLF